MKLMDGFTYVTRNNKNSVTVKKVKNGTNYIFENMDDPGVSYLQSGHLLHPSVETEEDLVDLYNMNNHFLIGEHYNPIDLPKKVK